MIHPAMPAGGRPGSPLRVVTLTGGAPPQLGQRGRLQLFGARLAIGPSWEADGARVEAERAAARVGSPWDR